MLLFSPDGKTLASAFRKMSIDSFIGCIPAGEADRYSLEGHTDEVLEVLLLVRMARAMASWIP